MHTFRHCNTHTFLQTLKHNYAELVMGMIMGFEALYAGRGWSNPVLLSSPSAMTIDSRFSG